MKLNVKTSMSDYDIIIENGTFDRLCELTGDLVCGRRIFAVTDDTVDGIYGERLRSMLGGENAKVCVLPHGEKTKSIEFLKHLYSELASFKMTRTDIIIAFGGGVIGDLTGFAAATFLRGIKYIQVPTTLLSQVDSSVGGKVAVDLPEGKNLVGNFYPPCRVIIDPLFINTLSDRIFSDGMAEVIKYGAIRDKALFEILFSDARKNLEKIIYSCVSIKKQIVENDEFDTGERMLLNFGHTFGHAVEKMGNYSEYTHGEGVAIGMLRITEKSEKMGLTEPGTSQKLRKLLEKYNLVFDNYKFDKNAANDIIMLDKKGDGNTINYVMLRSIGDAFIHSMPKDGAFLTED